MRPGLQIIHHPYGTDAPYFSGPDERTPRDPVGGDMVGIGFLTQPGGAADSVRLCWTRNGHPQAPIHGRPVALGTDADRWLCELGVVDGGDTVEYWMVATSDGQIYESPRYSFVTRRWCRPARFLVVKATHDGVRLTTLDDHDEPGPDVTVHLIQDGDAIQVQVSAGTEQQVGEVATSEMSVLHGAGISLSVDAASAQLRIETATHTLPLTMRWLREGDGCLAAVEFVGPLAHNESLVGFGERFDAFDQRGRAPDIVVWEQYKNQGNRTYLPVPFFCSSRGYGCLIEGTAQVWYDLGRTIPDRWRCLIEAGCDNRVVLDLFAGTPLEILRTFTALTGRPELPPTWAFGPWMSSNEWNTQARVECEVARTLKYGIPATALVIEAWSDETTFYIWNGAQYTPHPGDWHPRLADFNFPADGPWPDPKGMIDRLHEAGIRLLLWQIPALKAIDEPHAQHDADIKHALENGFVIRNDDGTPYRNPAFWFNRALIPDFTNAAATNWWLAKRAYLLDELGVDGFKTDGGEHLQGRDIQAADGRCGHELVNAYPNLYVSAYYRFARARRGEALTFSRAGHTGAGAFPAHWAGDENSTWEAFRRSITAGLSAAMSGIIFWGWDLAGFSDDLPSAELYLRAAAMAAFCPIMQYHSEYTPSGAPSKDRTPWRVQEYTGDERVISLYRFFARVRMNLLPYIRREAAYAAAHGEPLLRPLLLDDPDDPRVWRVDDQYRFGRDLLVAPVLDEGVEHRQLYLPAGRWYDLWEGACYTGGGWIDVAAPLSRIPVFVRGGAALPVRLGATAALGDDVGNDVDHDDGLQLWVYPSGQSNTTLLDTCGASVMIQIAEETERSVIVTLPPLDFALTLRLPDGTTRQVKASQAEQQIHFDE